MIARISRLDLPWFFRCLVQTLNLPALTMPESIRTPLDLLVPIPQTG